MPAGPGTRARMRLPAPPLRLSAVRETSIAHGTIPFDRLHVHIHAASVNSVNLGKEFSRLTRLKSLPCVSGRAPEVAKDRPRISEHTFSAHDRRSSRDVTEPQYSDARGSRDCRPATAALLRAIHEAYDNPLASKK